MPERLYINFVAFIIISWLLCAQAPGSIVDKIIIEFQIHFFMFLFPIQLLAGEKLLLYLTIHFLLRLLCKFFKICIVANRPQLQPRLVLLGWDPLLESHVPERRALDLLKRPVTWPRLSLELPYQVVPVFHIARRICGFCYFKLYWIYEILIQNL